MKMRGFKGIASSVLLIASSLLAQEIPAGTVIPVMLQAKLDARKAKTGQKIQARVMQDVPLPSQTRIRTGTKLVGHVVEVVRPSATSGSRIVISFDRLTMNGAAVPVTTSLRSLASMMDVFEAQMPTTAFADRGTSESDWVTVQIGGDVVYRGAGIVVSPDNQVVGKASDRGDVTGKMLASRDGGCRGAVAGNDREQALWLFSPSACGAYGFENLKITHPGRHDPVGQIVLESDRNVRLLGGSGLLLRVGTPSGSSTESPSAGATSNRTPVIKNPKTWPLCHNLMQHIIDYNNVVGAGRGLEFPQTFRSCGFQVR